MYEITCCPSKGVDTRQTNCISVYAMTDPCSTESLCTSELLDSLQVTERFDKVLKMTTIDSAGKAN